MKTLTITPKGYGHFEISTEHYGKTISCITTNTRAIDDWNDDFPKISAFNELRNEIIRKHKEAKK